jgi:hypothetical protein
MNCFDERLGKNIDKVKTNMIAAQELSSSFSSSATNLARSDQAKCVRNLKSRVLAEVKWLLDTEISAESGFAKGSLLFAPLSFAIGGLAGVLQHQANPVETGVNAAGKALSKRSPFGMVLVGIGKGGLPDDVKAIPLSRLARESKMCESEVRAILANRGYFLITQEVFAKTMDEVEHCVLNGVLSLPLTVDEFKKRMQAIIPGLFTIVTGTKLYRSTNH